MTVSVKINKFSADENGIVANFDIFANDKLLSNEYINLGKVATKDRVIDMILDMAKSKASAPVYYPPFVKDLEGKIISYNRVIKDGSN